MAKPLWTPSEHLKYSCEMQRFIDWVNQRYQLNISDYSALHQWSVNKLAHFWQSLWEFCKVTASSKPIAILSEGKTMRDSQWFNGAELNFAENLLKRQDSHPAILTMTEQGEIETISYTELNKQVCKLAYTLKQLGVKPGDRIAAIMPNIAETVIAMLASTSLGAVWSSCSPDFGLQGLSDRFEQIKPTILFAVNGHFYKGKQFNHDDKLSQLQKSLSSLAKTIIIPYVVITNSKPLDNMLTWQECLDNTATTLSFTQLPFNHPLYILYSSGTTGKPKCMVHGAGGTLLQHLKEIALHTNLTGNDRIFFNTTCGWMMWNWLVSSLAVGATLILYDDAPFHPNESVLFDLIDKTNATIFGIGAKYLESAAKLHLNPMQSHKLSTLHTILTTGSPLLPESFDYVYQKIKGDVQLSSISGGSDIISCFALGCPIKPVYCGELQCIGLGMDMKIYNENGNAVIAEKGELICASPFPSMPIYFWNDENDEKYQQAYFDQFPQVWTHGDFAEITEHGGLIIYGRSDATLNPSGVRIGTAEIYQQVEKLNDVIDALAIGQQHEGSERIILFVILQQDHHLTDELCTKIKAVIRDNTSPYHVPALIRQVHDLPRTLSGKVAELAVKKTINGEEINNLDALSNPESLQEFKY
jgi:acetoacetyl-CoA synthetase